MAADVDYFYYAVTNRSSLKCFEDINGLDIFRTTLMHRLDCRPYFVDTFPQSISNAFNHRSVRLRAGVAHVSTISTRFRGVQNVFVTQGAIAGVQRLAMLDFTK